MSTELFNRGYSLLVGPKYSGRDDDPNGLLIDELRVAFKIEKSLDAIPNTAVFDVYNLSKKSRSLLEESTMKKERVPAVIFNAGYGTNIKNLFTGDASFVVSKKAGADIQTTIECGDGEAAFASARLDKSFSPGATAGAILKDLKTALGIDTGQVKGFNSSDQFLNGLSLTGPVRNHLDLITKRQGLEWSIQNNQLQILPTKEALNEDVIVLNSATGLVGTPLRTKMVNQSLLLNKDGKQSTSGVLCTALLNGEIKPGRRVKIESDFFDGEIFKVYKCVYLGDSHSNSWFVEIEGVPL